MNDDHTAIPAERILLNDFAVEDTETCARIFEALQHPINFGSRHVAWATSRRDTLPMPLAIQGLPQCGFPPGRSMAKIYGKKIEDKFSQTSG
jgi:hypothetical protein